MKNFITGRMTIVPSLVGLAVWLWILDIIGVDVWVAARFAHFINLVAERVG